MLTLVVTVYNETLSETKTLKSLHTIFSKVSMPAKSQLIIYDNSFKSQEKQFLEMSYQQLDVSYKHNPSNPGIAEAYNYALEQANRLQHDWLIVLDQDTEVNQDYFNEILVAIEKPNQELVTFVPKITDGSQQISPVFIAGGGKVTSGIYQSKQEVMAINSGAMLSIPFLIKIGGFNTDFPLDYLDHWLFWKIRKEQKAIEVLATTLNHNLSVRHLKDVSSERYYSILLAEKRYNQQFGGQKKVSYYGHMLYRVAKCLIISPSKIKVIAKVLIQPE